ncbi:hypothetical protein [Cupriavidus basilensis]|uniref:hypothetical protein n=1 Tax=Cupriavidus basilensis TaxID=68895 RepID=UPI00284ED5B6|nr:hypothetical protein [Cupriavidus basilensis]MDR3381760.1 hypothetical protein [Cupriavidus basilensis]
MHTAVADTSIRAYHQAKKDGALSRQKRQIMAAIGPSPRDYSLQEIGKETGLPINVVSARVNELREEDGELERGPSRRCTITRKTIRPVRRPHPQGALF